MRVWADRWALPVAEGFAELWQGLGALVSPWACLACQSPIDEPPPRLSLSLPSDVRAARLRQARVSRVLCPTCRARLPLLSPGQNRSSALDNPVGYKLVAGLSPDPNLPHTAGGLGWAIAVYTFRQGGGVQRLIHALKYGGQPRACRAMGYLMAAHLQRQGLLTTESLTGLPPIDLITFVPSDPARERRRGYNQAEWLARGLAESIGIPVRGLLVKQRTRLSQTRLGRSGRLVNLSGAFVLSGTSRRKHDLSGRHILLVDDLVTTGATLSQAATPLIIAGARVSVAALASVP